MSPPSLFPAEDQLVENIRTEIDRKDDNITFSFFVRTKSFVKKKRDSEPRFELTNITRSRVDRSQLHNATLIYNCAMYIQ